MSTISGEISNAGDSNGLNETNLTSPETSDAYDSVTMMKKEMVEIAEQRLAHLDPPSGCEKDDEEEVVEITRRFFGKPITNSFYKEVAKISGMSADEVKAARFGLVVDGDKFPNPIEHWYQGGLMNRVLDALEDSRDYRKPSLLQRQVLPILMSGRDLIVYGKSDLELNVREKEDSDLDKVVSYILPLIRHCFNLKRRNSDPLALVIVSNMELMQSICGTSNFLGKGIKVKSLGLYSNSCVERLGRTSLEKTDILVCSLNFDVNLICQIPKLLNRVTFMVIHGEDLLGIQFGDITNTLRNRVRADCQVALFVSNQSPQVEEWRASNMKDPILIDVLEDEEVKAQILVNKFLSQFADDEEEVVEIAEEEVVERAEERLALLDPPSGCEKGSGKESFRDAEEEHGKT